MLSLKSNRSFAESNKMMVRDAKGLTSHGHFGNQQDICLAAALYAFDSMPIDGIEMFLNVEIKYSKAFEYLAYSPTVVLSILMCFKTFHK